MAKGIREYEEDVWK